MDSLVVAFGPNGEYFYGCRTMQRWQIGTGSLRNILLEDVGDVSCLTFGSGTNSNFMNATTKSGLPQLYHGLGIPRELRTWLRDPDSGQIRDDFDTRVTLGPDDSFVAWNSSSIRWSNIPRALEETLQELLGLEGWMHGPPRIVALGANRSWFVVTKHGYWAYYLIPRYMARKFRRLIDKYGSDRVSQNLVFASLSPFDRDYYIMVFRELGYFYSVPEETQLEMVMIRAESEQLTATERNRPGSAVKGKAEREMKEHEGWTKLYADWKAQCEKAFKFPQPPSAICTCVNVSCAARKALQGGIEACKHDMERLLRGSGEYSEAWLRKERLAWHPDRYQQKWAPKLQDDLVKKATEMYTIFEELLAQEREKEEG